MSTRACYRFVSRDGYEATVYVHHDGYPAHAWNYFARTLQSGLAWTLPRYEADEFAAAFVATVKTRPGSVRLIDKWNRAGDIDYLYKLTINHGVLILKVERVSAPATGPLKPSRWRRDTVYHGPLHRIIFAEGQLTGPKSNGMDIARINRLLQIPDSRAGL